MPEPKLFKWHRPSSYWDVVGHHLPMTLISGVMLLAARLVPFEKVSVVTCWFRRLTGYPCPSCGFTRAFRSMAVGDSRAAFTNSPLGAGLYALVCGILVWNAAALLLGVQLQRGRYLHLRRGTIWIVLLVTVMLVLANWVYRLMTGQH